MAESNESLVSKIIHIIEDSGCSEHSMPIKVWYQDSSSAVVNFDTEALVEMREDFLK